MTVELKAWFACEQRLEKRLALDELKIGDVPAFEMQEVESVETPWDQDAACQDLVWSERVNPLVP